MFKLKYTFIVMWCFLLPSLCSGQAEEIRFYRALLNNDVVREELNLAGDQFDAIYDLEKRATDLEGDYVMAVKHAVGDREILESEKIKYIQGMKAVEADVEEMLLPHQFKRFHQLLARYQVHRTEGARVSPIFSAAVGLKFEPGQEATIRTILSKREKDRQELIEKLKQDLIALDKEYDEKVNAELTPEQNSLVLEKIGPTVDFSRSVMSTSKRQPTPNSIE